EFSASFDDGGLSVKTGNYWFGKRGGTISGSKALSRVIRLLDLRVPRRTDRAWSIRSADVDRPESKRLIARSRRSKRSRASGRPRGIQATGGKRGEEEPPLTAEARKRLWEFVEKPRRATATLITPDGTRTEITASAPKARKAHKFTVAEL